MVRQTKWLGSLTFYLNIVILQWNIVNKKLAAENIVSAHKQTNNRTWFTQTKFRNTYNNTQQDAGSVLLPLPDGPTIAHVFPRGTFPEKPSKTTRSGLHGQAQHKNCQETSRENVKQWNVRCRVSKANIAELYITDKWSGCDARRGEAIDLAFALNHVKHRPRLGLQSRYFLFYNTKT